MIYIEYAQNMMYELCFRLGPDHKYNKVLQSILDAQDSDQASNMIATVCDDPDIQKLYFPIHIDAVAQAEWCRAHMCRIQCAPKRSVEDVYMKSNGLSMRNLKFE